MSSSCRSYSSNIDEDEEHDEELCSDQHINTSANNITPMTMARNDNKRKPHAMEVEFSTNRSRRNGGDTLKEEEIAANRQEQEELQRRDDFEVDKIVSKYFFSGNTAIPCRTIDDEEEGCQSTSRLSILSSAFWKAWHSIVGQSEHTSTYRSPPPPPPKLKPRFSIADDDSTNSYKSDSSNSWPFVSFTQGEKNSSSYNGRRISSCFSFRLVMFTILITFTVAVIVMLVVPITQRTGVIESTSNNITTTSASGQTTLTFDLSDLLQEVTSVDVLIDQTQSPQHRAMKWMMMGQESATVDLSSYTNKEEIHFIVYHLYQRYAMATLYYSLGGNDILPNEEEEGESFFNIISGWADSTNWLSSNSVCTWKGVTCNYFQQNANLVSELCEDGGVVSEISIPKNRLDGTIPNEVFILKYLQVLRLNQNNIKGSLPSTIRSCDSLLEIDISHNQMQGNISNLLDQIMPQSRTIQNLILDNNKFHGSIPGEKLVAFDALRIFSISNNQISGMLPSGFALPPSLIELKLDHNLFQGTLPSEWGSQKNELILFNLGYNKDLTGTLPDTFFQLFQSSLETLNLEHTSVVGTIPKWIHELYSLEVINLSNTFIEGTIPPQLGLLSSLHELNLGETKLSGSLPKEVCNLREVGELNVLIVNCGGQTPTVQCDCCSECTTSSSST